ncbi:four-domain proteases inhibitor-like isoform X2 [Penaeus indicus]|uniref:four-domain proteases inhibitor-like isoform X2 n=1 Tax=Penaeus indicus TaxID=29960 RepID=UPI00300C4E31
MKSCLFLSLFLLASGQDTCDLPCHYHLDPVCGSDGVTYPNLCSLQVVDCLSDEDITLAYPGECQARRETCDLLCPANYDPVCGSDGVTYPNLCNLLAADCLSENNITLAHPGECQAPCDVGCPYNYDPVCGSDGVTYPNLCSLQVVDCLSDEDLTLAYPGECKENCDLACPANYDPVCGSDGVTYSNLCNLQVADCISDEDLTLAHTGPC